MIPEEEEDDAAIDEDEAAPAPADLDEDAVRAQEEAEDAFEECMDAMLGGEDGEEEAEAEEPRQNLVSAYRENGRRCERSHDDLITTWRRAQSAHCAFLSLLLPL